MPANSNPTPSPLQAAAQRARARHAAQRISSRPAAGGGGVHTKGGAALPAPALALPPLSLPTPFPFPLFLCRRELIITIVSWPKAKPGWLRGCTRLRAGGRRGGGGGPRQIVRGTGRDASLPARPRGLPTPPWASGARAMARPWDTRGSRSIVTTAASSGGLPPRLCNRPAIPAEATRPDLHAPRSLPSLAPAKRGQTSRPLSGAANMGLARALAALVMALAASSAGEGSRPGRRGG